MPRRSNLQIHIDNNGVPSIVGHYLKLRKIYSEAQAETIAMGAGAESTRRMWRGKADAGEEPYLTVFKALREAEEEHALAELPGLYEAIKGRNPVELFRILFPRRKWRLDEEARAMMLDGAHAEHLRQFIGGENGLAVYLRTSPNVPDLMTREDAIQVLYDFVEARDRELVDADPEGDE